MFRTRSVRGVPMGLTTKVYFDFDIHRIYCKKRMMENIPFLFHPMARIIKALENEVLKMRLGADIKHTKHFN